jgi:hypothetical protein
MRALLLDTRNHAGFSATVDAYAKDEGQIWFMSMLGGQQAVSAIWARLIKDDTSYLAGVGCFIRYQGD